jgi:hypoxanthine phosphoribosyltransferase
VIIEDIVDTGKTLNGFLPQLHRGAVSYHYTQLAKEAARVFLAPRQQKTTPQKCSILHTKMGDFVWNIEHYKNFKIN